MMQKHRHEFQYKLKCLWTLCMSWKKYIWYIDREGGKWSIRDEGVCEGIVWECWQVCMKGTPASHWSTVGQPTAAPPASPANIFMGIINPNLQQQFHFKWHRWRSACFNGWAKVCPCIMCCQSSLTWKLIPVCCRKGFSSSGSIASIVECVSAIFMSLYVAIKFVYH
jgi:hypothetical protein